MLRKPIYAVGILSLIFLTLPHIMPGAMAQAAKPLSQADRSRAIEIEKQVVQDRSQSVTIAGAPDKSIVTSIVPLGAPVQAERSSSTPQPRRAEVSRFEYATGVTVRTVVNLDTGEVLATRRNTNFPTPLAPQEFEDAKALLIKTVPAVESIVSETGRDNVEFMHLVSVAPSKQSKRYGHRVVILWINKPKRTTRYTVNLTTGDVE